MQETRNPGRWEEVKPHKIQRGISPFHLIRFSHPFIFQNHRCPLWLKFVAIAKPQSHIQICSKPSVTTQKTQKSSKQRNPERRVELGDLQEVIAFLVSILGVAFYMFKDDVLTEVVRVGIQGFEQKKLMSILQMWVLQWRIACLDLKEKKKIVSSEGRGGGLGLVVYGRPWWLWLW